MLTLVDMPVPDQATVNRATRHNGQRTLNWNSVINNNRIHRSPTPDAEDAALRLPPALRQRTSRSNTPSSAANTEPSQASNIVQSSETTSSIPS